MIEASAVADVLPALAGEVVAAACFVLGSVSCGGLAVVALAPFSDVRAGVLDDFIDGTPDALGGIGGTFFCFDSRGSKPGATCRAG